MTKLTEGQKIQIRRMKQGGKKGWDIERFFQENYHKKLDLAEQAKIETKESKKKAVKVTIRKNKSPNKPTYLPFEELIFWRIPVDYTEKDKKEIISYLSKNMKRGVAFSKKKREAALREIASHASTLFSWLVSKITPYNAKRTERNEQLIKLNNCLLSLEKQLDICLQQAGHPNAIQLKKRFHELYPKIRLADFQEMICSLMAICGEIKSSRDLVFDETKLKTKSKAILDLIKRSKEGCSLNFKEIKRLNKFLIKKEYFATPMIQRKPYGSRNPAYFNFVSNLAATWKKYTGKKPTLQSKTHKLDVIFTEEQKNVPEDLSKDFFGNEKVSREEIDQRYKEAAPKGKQKFGGDFLEYITKSLSAIPYPNGSVLLPSNPKDREGVKKGIARKRREIKSLLKENLASIAKEVIYS